MRKIPLSPHFLRLQLLYLEIKSISEKGDDNLTHLTTQYYLIYLAFLINSCLEQLHAYCSKTTVEKTSFPLMLFYMFWLLLPLFFSMWLMRYYFITEHLKQHKLPQLSYFPQEIQCRFKFSSLLHAAMSSLFNLRTEMLFQKGQWATINTWGHFLWKQSGREQIAHPAPLLGILKCFPDTWLQL